MKRKNEQLLRVETVLNNDRLRLKEDFSKLLEADLTKLLMDYFYFNGSPTVEIVKKGSGFEVSINFTCNQVKNFINLP